MALKILVTGAGGFIGRNFCSYVENTGIDAEIIRFDMDNNLIDLEKACNEADAVVHLAGINRPKTDAEFFSGNTNFTKKLVSALKKAGKKVPVVMSSSIQAELDNAYGQSKLQAEEVIFHYQKKTGVNSFIFRLPNVFGKWCRPNYNSVVATWCHNIARDMEIQIDDPDTMIDLVYVSDVVAAFLHAILEGYHKDENGYCHVPEVYEISLGQLADKLHSFRSSRDTLVLPGFQYRLDSLLYATYLSYLPEDGLGYELDMKRDERGWLAEFIKKDEIGQVFISKTKPGITRGNHWHQRKVEKFLVVAGEGKISFRLIDGDEVIEYRVSGDNLTVVDIPVGYTHCIENVGDTDMVTLFWSDEVFDLEDADTNYLDVYVGLGNQ